jgi:hypothetical protein
MYIFYLSLPFCVADKLFVVSELFIFISLHESDHGSVLLGISFFLVLLSGGQDGFVCFCREVEGGTGEKRKSIFEAGVD